MKWLISKALISLSSIFGAGFTTFGIRALDSRVLLPQTGHRGIFAINFFYKGSEAKSFRVRSQDPEKHRRKISEFH